MTISVAHYNAAFPRYPVTVEDKGWIYGVWYCGTGWQRVKLHGQYPRGFLDRALSLFPDAVDILHCPSGTLVGVPGITVDAISDDVRKPDIVADASDLPFDDATFDLVLSDPPYTPKDSKIYGMPRFPERRFLKECHRILRPGGYLAMLHTRYPFYRRQDWDLRALIAVVTGAGRATRMFSILERRQTTVAPSVEAPQRQHMLLGLTPSDKEGRL